MAAAHDAGAIAVVDASQYVPHVATDVPAWGADFVAFTGHKMCGPTGIGVLWGTSEILDATPPFLTGGEMILNVTKEGFTTNELPWKFEAGTPPIAEAVGLGAAVDYLTSLGMEAVREHEVSLTAYALRTLTERFGDDLVIHGPVRARPSGAACCRSPSPTCTPTTSPRCSTSTACACGPATTAPSRSCACSAWPPPPVPPCTSTTTKPTSTPSADAIAAAADFFAF